MEEEIKSLLLQWANLKTEIEQHHRNREQKELRDLMVKGIELFYQFLFRSNDKDFIKKVPGVFSFLEFKPVNVSERIEFISERPLLFHSFIQLAELMVEQEKIYQKKLAMKKVSRK